MSETAEQQSEATIPVEQPPPGDAPTWDAVAAVSEAADAAALAKPKVVKKWLRVRLSPEAKNRLYEEHVKACDRVESLKEDLANHAKRARKQIAAEETAAKGLREAVNRDVEERVFNVHVNCIEETGAIEYIDAKTGQIIDVVPMTADDRGQLSLADAARNGGNGHAADDDGSAEDLDDEDDAESPDLEDRLERAIAEGDDDGAPPVAPAWLQETTPYEGRKTDDDEPSGPAIDDPAAVLAAADTNADADTSADAPAPKRARGRRKP